MAPFFPFRRKNHPPPVPVDPYTAIAEHYDVMLRHVDYQEWYEFIRDCMLHFTHRPRSIVELGCGTGRFGLKFAHDGFSILGIDRSLPMLAVAKARAHSGFSIACADMRRLPVAGTVDFVFSVHDTMNYFLEKKDIAAVLSAVRGILRPGSAFLFDTTTEYNILHNFENKPQRFSFREKNIEWNNEYDRERRMVTSILTVNHGGSRVEERHYQRIYATEEIIELIEAAGLQVRGIFSDYTFDPPDKETVMINYVAGL